MVHLIKKYSDEIQMTRDLAKCLPFFADSGFSGMPIHAGIFADFLWNGGTGGPDKILIEQHIDRTQLWFHFDQMWLICSRYKDGHFECTIEDLPLWGEEETEYLKSFREVGFKDQEV
jgi:hypothetical protein